MTSPTYWIIIFSVNVLLSRGQQCGGTAAEGDKLTLTCSLGSPNKGLVWKLKQGTRYVDISLCTSSGSCTDLKKESFQAVCKQLPTQTPVQGCIGQLKIVGVNRKESFIKCETMTDVQREECSLQVYVPPDVPTCQSPELTSDQTGTYIRVTCSSENIYPHGVCQFTQKGHPSNISASVTTSHSPSVRNPDNFRIECSWSALLTGLDPGNVQVQVQVYPALNKRIEAATVTGLMTPRIELSYPSVALATDCPTDSLVRNGYVLAGVYASCRCDLTSPGYPPGFAQWYTGNGEAIGRKLNNGSAVLSLFDASPGAAFVCHSVSVISNPIPQKIWFPFQFAVGPSTLTIDLSDAHHLCPSESFTYRVTCKVPRLGVAPQPLFTIIINNQTVISSQRGQIDKGSDHYSLTYIFRPLAGGSLSIFCKAANDIFSQERFYEFERPFIIYEPPRSAPVLRTHDNQPAAGSNIAHVTEGGTVYLICQIDGGYPETSNITIVCLHFSSTMQGVLATLRMTVPNATRSMPCYCSASHVTGCYNKRAEIVLTVDKQGNTNKEDPPASTITLGLGLGLGLGGAAVLLAVGLVAGLVMLRRRNANLHYSQPDYVYSASYQYASFLPGRPDLPQRPKPDQQSQGDYDLITLDTVPARVPSDRIISSSKHESTTDSFQDNEGYEQPI